MENLQHRVALALLSYAAQRSVAASHLCSLSGIDYVVLARDASVRLTPVQFEQLWKNAAHLTQDPLFGLHFGESMQLAALGVVGQVILTSNTVGEALDHAGAMAHLLTDLYRFRISRDSRTTTLYFMENTSRTQRYPHTARHFGDYLIVFALHELDGLLLERIEPLSARFPYAIPYHHEYTRIFRCPVKGKAGDLSIEFHRRYEDLTILSANYGLQNFLLQRVTAICAREPDETTALQQRVFHYLLSNSYRQMPGLEAVAANFNFSPRSLQRHLEEEGTRFSDIVNQVRQQLAQDYLCAGQYPIKDIAAMLGYEEQRAFLRAFRRWTGLSPAAWRRQQQAGYA